MTTKAGSALAADNPDTGDGGQGGEGGAGAEGGQGGAGAEGGAGGAGEGEWFEKVGIDPRFHETVKAKGWKDPNDVLDSYVNVEKLVSMERGGEMDRILVKPKDDATPEEKAAFRDKAGFAPPKSAEEYGFTPELLQQAPVLADAAKWFHAAGVPKDAADKIVEQAINHDKELAEAFLTKSDQEYTSLAQQMGDKFGDFEEAGRRAFRASGLDQDAINRLEMSLGTKPMMEMFAKFGQAMTEAQAPTPGRTGVGQFTVTADSAKGRIETLKKDSDFQAKLLSTNPEVRKAAQAEWTALHEAAFPPEKQGA
jgi:hypothetical protein